MFPSVHGVVSQGGVVTPPDPGGAFWLWPAAPAGPNLATVRAGYKFVPSTALLVKAFRHASTSAISTARLTHLYAADDQPYAVDHHRVLAEGAVNSDQLGWVEMPASREVVLYAGRPYILVGGHSGGSPTRIATVPVGEVALNASVAFQEPATSATSSGYPTAGAGDSTVTAVDALVEPYPAPVGDGWAARVDQIGARNDAPQGGWAFTPQVDVTVSKVRVANTGASANYTVRIWRVSDQALVASATFDATGLTEHTLAAPVALSQGVQYVITAARNTNNVIRLFSDTSTGLVVRSLVSFDGGRSAASNSGFPGTNVGYWQGVDMYLEAA